MPTKSDPVIPDKLANAERRECFRRGFRLFYKFEQEKRPMTGEEFFVCSVQLRPHSVVARAIMATMASEYVEAEQKFISIQDAGAAFVDAVRCGLDLIAEAS